MADTAWTNCTDCPSYLQPDETQQYFKKNIGAPMCARFGHVLGKPGLAPVGIRRIGEAFAADCHRAGEERPPTGPSNPKLLVSTGDPTIKMTGMPTDAERAQVSSCAGCKNYVEPGTVREEFGWGTGLCAATGRLILGNRLSVEAKNCDWRAPGASRQSTTGIFLSPTYEEAFTAADPIKSFIARSGRPVVDPTEYETDKPVEDDDRAHGIRAWRRVDDPGGSDNHTFLPIFDTAFFDDAEQAKIPRTGDDEHPEWYVDHAGAVYKVAVLWRELDETPAVWGDAGTGKTELFRHLAWAMNLPFERISITARSEVEDLLGKWLASDGSTYFQYGRIPKAWQKPCVFCMDEPNTGPDEVWQTIRPMTDNSKQLVLDQADGARVARNDDCYFGMAMNPAWDAKNVGANTLADADGNRLGHLFMPLPSAEIERAILRQRCEADGYAVTDETMNTVMSVASDLRALIDDESLTISWGIRPMIKVIRATRWFNTLEAFRIGVTDSLDPEQAQTVLDVVKTYVPTE